MYFSFDQLAAATPQLPFRTQRRSLWWRAGSSSQRRGIFPPVTWRPACSCWCFSCQTPHSIPAHSVRKCPCSTRFICLGLPEWKRSSKRLFFGFYANQQSLWPKCQEENLFKQFSYLTNVSNVTDIHTMRRKAFFHNLDCQSKTLVQLTPFLMLVSHRRHIFRRSNSLMSPLS